MRVLTTGVIVTVLLLGALGATSGEETTAVDGILSRVQTHYAGIQAMRCAFEQENQYLGGDSLVQVGTLEVERPARMRWDYAEPTRREFISNGERLWIYHPEEKRAFVVEDVDSAGHAQLFGFVLGLQDVRSHFDVKLLPDSGGHADRIRLELLPLQSMAGIAKVWVDVAPENAAIIAVTIDDGMGNATITRLSDVTTMDDIADIRFTFDAPEGVEVMPYP